MPVLPAERPDIGSALEFGSLCGSLDFLSAGARERRGESAGPVNS